MQETMIKWIKIGHFKDQNMAYPALFYFSLKKKASSFMNIKSSGSSV